MEDNKNKEELVLTEIKTDDQDREIKNDSTTNQDKKETIVVESKKEKKQKDKSDNNLKKKGFGFKLKTFFYGLGKEFERMSWTTKSDLVKNFIVVVCIVVILTAIFTGVGIGMQKLLSL